MNTASVGEIRDLRAELARARRATADTLAILNEIDTEVDMGVWRRPENVRHARDAVRRARRILRGQTEALIEAWHRGDGAGLELHEYLGMTWEQYKAWAGPKAAAVPAAATDDEPDHPERKCWRCLGPNVSWSAPSPLWNEVMRGGDINGAEIHNGIVCPTCFAVLAQEAKIADLWRMSAERVHVELQTVTPTGRTWDADSWLWRDAP